MGEERRLQVPLEGRRVIIQNFLRANRRGELVLVIDCTWVQPMEINVIWPQTQLLPAKTRVAIDALVTKIPTMLEKGTTS